MLGKLDYDVKSARFLDGSVPPSPTRVASECSVGVMNLYLRWDSISNLTEFLCPSPLDILPILHNRFASCKHFRTTSAYLRTRKMIYEDLHLVPKYARIHGLEMGLAFVILFPLGALFIRVLKFKGSVWAHVVCQLVGWVLMLAGLATGIRLGKIIDQVSIPAPSASSTTD